VIGIRERAWEQEEPNNVEGRAVLLSNLVVVVLYS